MYPLEFFPKKLGNDIFAELCRSLPPPADDSPDARDTRDTIAMIHLADFRPATAEEAMLAVRVVAAEAHARDCLRLAAASADDVRQIMRCRNQAATMMREADRARKELRLCQVARVNAQALALVTSLANRAESAPATEPEAAAAPAAVPEAVPESVPESLPGAVPGAVKDAEDFVRIFPRVAMRPRRREDPTQAPGTELRPEEVPAAAVVEAVIHANSPVPQRVDGLAAATA